MDYLDSPDFEAHVKVLMKDWHVPGAAAAFYHKGKTTSRAFGVTSIDSGKPCTPDSLFDIASCSKSFTAASVGILIHDEEKHPGMEWTTPMCKLLPEDFVMSKDEYTHGVTIEDILSHRTGLPGHDNSYLSQSASEPDTAASVTRNLRNLQITTPIRTKFQYCNMFYTVATHLVETQSKLPFAEFLHKNIFAPLGMTSTHLFHSAATAAGLSNRLTSPHSYSETHDSFAVIPWAIDPEAQGAGSICTSVNDLILYIKALVNHTPPFTADLVAQLTTPRTFLARPADKLDPLTSHGTYALGWEVYFYRGYRIVQHDGLINGFGGRCFFVPSLDAGGVVLGNASGIDGLSDTLCREFIDSILDIPASERIDWATRIRDEAQSYKREHEEEIATMRQSLMADGQTEAETQNVPLSAYEGLYHNTGYHTLRVEVRDEALFIDARDRSMGFTLAFEHISAGRLFVAKLVDRDDPEDTDDLKAEFEFEGEVSGGKVVRMGLALEPLMDELIWFDRV